MDMQSGVSVDDPCQRCECEKCVCSQGQSQSSSLVLHVDHSHPLDIAPVRHLTQHIYVVLSRIVTPYFRPPIIW
jgi:hypothetical protein